MAYEFLKPSNNQERPATPEILSYKVDRDNSFLGYKVRFRWVHDFDPSKIIGFKIWKANSSQVLLDKTYDISQSALEKLTAIKSFYAPNNALYNKCFISQNSKVKFFNSESDRYDKVNETEEYSGLEFKQIDFIKEEQDGLYEYLDKNVKFGETYYYAVSLMTKDLYETDYSHPIKINIEDLESPDSPFFKISETASGALIFVSTNTIAEDVSFFRVYRRSETETDFSKISEIKSEGNFINFVDGTLVPGKKYYYKVHSVDFFGNESYFSEQIEFVLSSIFPSKKGTSFPKVTITSKNSVAYIEIEKTADETQGCRVERRDTWRQEVGFENKKYNQVPWPNVNFFDQNNKISLIDNTVSRNRSYSYRVTAFKKNGSIANYWITPPLEISDELNYSANFEDVQTPQPVSLNSFQIDILDERQSPIYSRISWDIEGSWSYLELELEQQVGSNSIDATSTLDVIKVDSVHSSIYLNNLVSGNNYIINMTVYDHSGNKIFETEEDRAIRISL